MREPRTIEGSPVPLFDRLSGRDPGRRDAAPAPRILDRRSLLRSVQDDVSRLLNSRSAPERDPATGAAGTVLDYGIPDFSTVTPSSEAELQRLAALIARKVASYEPRLVNVRVAVTSPANSRAVMMSLTASLRIGSVNEPVTFPLIIDRSCIRMEPA